MFSQVFMFPSVHMTGTPVSGPRSLLQPLVPGPLPQPLVQGFFSSLWSQVFPGVHQPLIPGPLWGYPSQGIPSGQDWGNYPSPPPQPGLGYRGQYASDTEADTEMDKKWVVHKELCGGVHTAQTQVIMQIPIGFW